MTRHRLARGVLRNGLVPRLAKAQAGSVLGCWDVPSEPELLAGSVVHLAGWATSGGRTPLSISILRDGEILAETRPTFPRIDVASHLGLHSAAELGWEVSIALELEDVDSLLEVVAHNGTERISFGARRVQVADSSALIDGKLDLPMPDSHVVAGGTLRVSGWTLFDKEPAESVHVFVGDEPSIAVRTALPRPDIFSAHGGPGAEKVIAAGFSDLIPIPYEWSGRTVEVVAQARSLDGRTWVSERVIVAVEAREESPEDFDQVDALRPFVAEAAQLVRQGTPPRARARVCAFTHSLNLGGGELYLQELLVRLARDHDMDILVVAPHDGPLRRELREAGIAVHLTRAYAYTPGHYTDGVEDLAALLAVWQPDAVLVNTLGVFPAVDAALRMGLPVLWAIHESFALETFACLNWGDGGLHTLVHDRWLECLRSAYTIFESHATLEMFRKQVPELQGAVVHYGIELSRIEEYRDSFDRAAEREELGFAPDELVLLCMGVIQERKAQLNLVLAFNEVARTHPSARLVLVGDHPWGYAESVHRLVESLGLEDRIRIEPVQPDTYKWYMVADVLVSASDTESLPRSVLESMTFGRPALAADVFGLSEVIDDGLNGWLCRSHSRASLIAGLKRVLECSREDLDKLSRQCREHSVDFDGAHYAAEYARLVKDFAAQRSGATNPQVRSDDAAK